MPKDYTNVPNTCSLIDNVINSINKIDWAEDELDLEKEMLANIEELENIRNHNSDLRIFGNEQYTRAEELENELYDAKNKIETLEDIISNLEDN